MAAAAIALWLSLAGCQGRLQPQTPLVQGTVQQIISGNSLEVTIPTLANNQIQRVRLIGLDAPSPAQRPWGKAAMDFLRQVEKQTIQLEFDLEREAPYNRLLAYVWHDGQLLNADLLAAGHALLDSRLPNIRYDGELRRAQESARLQGLGIWDPANPMRQTPDEFQETRTP
ncbi:MAG: thermonuclease family protein [Synechococcales cyanobacterium RM1_1_8]|nr:thermonuclease family protein [Synechococcales cyanobacterium RM1_1_8]